MWKKSSFSGDSSCVEVEVGETSGDIYVRNSNRIFSGTVSFTHDEWTAFIKGVKAGEFDL